MTHWMPHRQNHCLMNHYSVLYTHNSLKSMWSSLIRTENIEWFQCSGSAPMFLVCNFCQVIHLCLYMLCFQSLAQMKQTAIHCSSFYHSYYSMPAALEVWAHFHKDICCYRNSHPHKQLLCKCCQLWGLHRMGLGLNWVPVTCPYQALSANFPLLWCAIVAWSSSYQFASCLLMQSTQLLKYSL